MTNNELFRLSAGITTCLTFAGALLHASLPAAGERPVAPSTSVALIDNCRLSGVVAGKDNALAAEFEAENTGSTETNVDFYYSVECTPAMSTMSRMMPSPRSVTNGHCVITVPAGASRIERIPLPTPPSRAALLTAAMPAVSNAPERSKLEAAPDHWALLVSRTELPKAAGWGGVPPAIAFATNRLDKGTLVLASSSDIAAEPAMIAATPTKAKASPVGGRKVQ